MNNVIKFCIFLFILFDNSTYGAEKKRHHSTHQHGGTQTGVGVLDSVTISKVQSALSAQGSSVPSTGSMNPDTQAAIIKFQKDNGLAPTGHLNKKTLEALGVTPSGNK